MGLIDGPQITRRARLTSGTGQTTTTLVPFDKSNGQAGMYAPSGMFWLPSAFAVAANAGKIARFVPSRNMTITNIAFAVTAVTIGDTANPNVDVGIYTAALAKIVTSGATAGKLTTTGVKQVTITTTALTAGTVYYAGISVGAIGTTTASIMGVSPASLSTAQLFGATAGLCELDSANTVHPLPDPWVIGQTSGTGPLLALRES